MTPEVKDPRLDLFGFHLYICNHVRAAGAWVWRIVNDSCRRYGIRSGDGSDMGAAAGAVRHSLWMPGTGQPDADRAPNQYETGARTSVPEPAIEYGIDLTVHRLGSFLQPQDPGHNGRSSIPAT